MNWLLDFIMSDIGQGFIGVALVFATGGGVGAAKLAAAKFAKEIATQENITKGIVMAVESFTDKDTPFDLKQLNKNIKASVPDAAINTLDELKEAYKA